MTEKVTTSNASEEIQRGREASYLLQNPMIKGALEAIEGFYEREWKNTTIEEVDKREEAYRMLLMANAFKMLLTKYGETGTLAEHQSELDKQKQNNSD